MHMHMFFARRGGDGQNRSKSQKSVILGILQYLVDFGPFSCTWWILADSPVLSGFWAILQKIIDLGNFCGFGEVGRRGLKIIGICTCFSPVEAAMAKIVQNRKNP